MKKAVFLDRDSLGLDLDIQSLTNLPFEWHIYDNTRPEEVAERIREASVVITNKAPVSRAAMAQATHLEYIGLTATGYNIIDIEAAGESGIIVSNVVNYGTPGIVQHCWALILSLATRLKELNQAVKAGRWQQSPFFCLLDYPVYELHGKTLGIVGNGTLGQGVADIAKAFGMKVKIAALPGREYKDQRVPFNELIEQADVLSLHCPLTAQTENLIDEQVLEKMKPTAILVNTARGALVKEQALINALKTGQIAAAGLDVLRVEPPTHANPLLSAELPNLIITPHAAWVARESRQRLIEQVSACLQGYQNGKPENVINPSRG